jgi:hypothetical protein
MDTKKEMSGKVSQWLTSPEAQQKLREAHDEAEQTAEYLREASRVDPESLHKPFNV